MDVGRWLTKQTQPAVWARLLSGQRALLEQLRVTPPEVAPAVAPGKAVAAPGTAREEDAGNAEGAGPTAFGVLPAARTPTKGRGSASFERGVAAARQYLAREGHLTRWVTGSPCRRGGWPRGAPYEMGRETQRLRTAALEAMLRVELLADSTEWERLGRRALEESDRIAGAGSWEGLDVVGQVSRSVICEFVG
ncbi:hypothetical protein SAMN06297387_107206 [Streptomyces zhaozhouensis]|uniref:Uncharacterized protein n=2 Tax=Streptomyces zhaozhouensis TaxID=1300267 RepID=A0A286DVZ8_9ACTN|nr:hypothetical protein SAMN06297387_107206 [Streptomyces zhaozhouensis]